MRLHPHSVDRAVGAAAVGEVEDRLGHVVDRGEVNGLRTARGGQREPFRHQVHTDDSYAGVQGDPGRELAHRSEPEHRQGVALSHLGELEGLPGGGQDVGQVEVALVVDPLGNLDRPELRLGHPQVLRLAAGHRAVQGRVAEQARTLAELADLGRLALREEATAAHPAGAAGDVEGDDDPVADVQVAGVRTHLLDDAHGLVAEDVAPLQEGAEHLVEMEVGSADGGRGHADDGVVGLLDHRVGDRLHRDGSLALPGQCSHQDSLWSWAGTVVASAGVRRSAM